MRLTPTVNTKYTTANSTAPAFFTLLIIGIGCEKEDPKQNPETDYIEYTESSGEIGSGGGSLVINDPNSTINGAKVEIPEGALNNTEIISISKNSTEIVGFKDALLLHFEPKGLEFVEPIKQFLPLPGS